MHTWPHGPSGCHLPHSCLAIHFSRVPSICPLVYLPSIPHPTAITLFCVILYKLKPQYGISEQEMPRAPPSSFNKHVQGLCQRHRPNEALCLVPTAFIVEGGASPCLHAHSAPQPILMVQLTCPEQGNPVPQSQPMAPLGAFMTSYHLRGPRVHM